MAKDEHVVIRAAVYACLAVALMQILIYGIGGFINLANPTISPSETVMIWAAKSSSQFIGGAITSRYYGCWLVFCIHFPVSYWV